MLEFELILALNLLISGTFQPVARYCHASEVQALSWIVVGSKVKEVEKQMQGFNPVFESLPKGLLRRSCQTNV